MGQAREPSTQATGQQVSTQAVGRQVMGLALVVVVAELAVHSDVAVLRPGLWSLRCFGAQLATR